MNRVDTTQQPGTLSVCRKRDHDNPRQMQCVVVMSVDANQHVAGAGAFVLCRVVFVAAVRVGVVAWVCTDSKLPAGVTGPNIGVTCPNTVLRAPPTVDIVAPPTVRSGLMVSTFSSYTSKENLSQNPRLCPRSKGCGLSGPFVYHSGVLNNAV